jgi:hypothetical protein
MNHQEGFTRKNSRQWINAGYNPCTKGMHKSQFPSFRRSGAGEIIANKFKSLISAYFPDPTENINAVYANDIMTDDITVIMSNRVTKKGNKQTAKVTCRISEKNVWPANAAVPKCTYNSSIAGHCGNGSSIHIRHGGSQH